MDDKLAREQALAVIEKLVENGCKQYGWRDVDGVPALCVIGVAFTIVANNEDKAAFERKMEAFARGITKRGYPVEKMKVEQREGKRPWASFECQTPQYRLPRLPRRRQ